MGQADQKVIAGRYRVAPRTLCFITHGDKVLLLKGAPDKRIWPNKYNGVGGHIEPHEDVYSAALREIEEETGLKVRDLRLRGVIHILADAETNKGILLFVFTASAASRDIRPSEEGMLEWVARERITELDLVEDLPILLPRVLARQPDAPPFFAHYRYDEQDRLVASFSEPDATD